MFAFGLVFVSILCLPVSSSLTVISFAPVLPLLRSHRHQEVTDTMEAKRTLLRSLQYCHQKIIEGHEDIWMAGTTTFLGGMLMKIKTESDKKNDEFAFVCANIGDCKAFIWDCETQRCRDITAGNRAGLDAKDCGGRLGPYVGKGQPDTRNLGCYFSPCKPGDVILIVSDGVHDNLGSLNELCGNNSCASRPA